MPGAPVVAIEFGLAGVSITDAPASAVDSIAPGHHLAFVVINDTDGDHRVCTLTPTLRVDGLALAPVVLDLPGSGTYLFGLPVELGGRSDSILVSWDDPAGLFAVVLELAP